MTIEELVSQMQAINQAMRQPRQGMIEDKINERERTLAKAVKVGEETGELHQAVLGMLHMQSPRKDRKKMEIEKEIADLVLATISLALHLNIDMGKILKERLVVINKRFKISQ